MLNLFLGESSAGFGSSNRFFAPPGPPNRGPLQVPSLRGCGFAAMMELPQPSGEPVGKMILRYFSYMVIMMLTFSGIRVYDKVCGALSSPG